MLQLPSVSQTFIDEAFARNRAIFGCARMDGETGGEGGEGSAGDGGKSSWRAPESQEEFDRIINARLSRERAKYADYDDLRTKAAMHDALEAELGTAADKAAAAARTEAEGKTRETFVPRLVRAEFKAAAAGKIDGERLKELIEDIDLSRYVDDKGEIDEDKVAKKVKAWAGDAGGGDQQGNGGANGGHRTFGQGNRPPAKAKPGDGGAAYLARKFPQKA